MSDDWPRAGRVIRARRETLRLPQGAGGVSAATWRKVENAVDPPYRRSTLVAICEALGWTHDSIERVLNGQEPIEVQAQSLTRDERLAKVEHDLATTVTEFKARFAQIEAQLAQQYNEDPDIEALRKLAERKDLPERMRGEFAKLIQHLQEPLDPPTAAEGA